MSKIKLDLKSFKHVKSDDNCTTLKHKDGHSLTIAHSALSPEARAQLDALKVHKAEGGDVKPKDESAMSQAMRELPGDVAHAFSPSGLADTAKTIYNAGKRIVNGEVTPASLMAEGGEVKEDEETLDYKKMKDERKEKKSKPENTLDYAALKKEYLEKNRAKYAEGSLDDLVSMQDAPQAQIDPQTQAVRDQYDSLVTGYGNLPNRSAGSLKDQPPSFKDFNPGMFTPEGKSTSPATFSSHPEGPNNFNPAAWNTAKREVANTQAHQSMLEQEHSQNVAQDNQARLDAGLPPIPGALDPQAQPQLAEPASLPGQPPAIQQPHQAQPGNNPEGIFSGGYNNSLAGIQHAADATGKLGQEQAHLLDEAAKGKQEAVNHYQTEYTRLDNERQALQEDIQNGHVDPNKFWDNHSKLATSIGVLLAGFNPTGRPNMAIEQLNKDMDRNIDAQKTNLNSKHNLLRANLEQFRNIKDATDMTRIMQSDILSTQLQQAAATAQTPMAKAAAEQAAGQLKMQAASQFQQFAMRRAMMGLAGGQNGASNPAGTEHMLNMMDAMNPGSAKNYRERYVPGMAGSDGSPFASVPIPDTVRTQLRAHQDVNRTMNEVLQFAQKHHGTINPSERAVGATLMNQLQSAIRVAEQQGVYKESEAHFMSDTLGSNPANPFSTLLTSPKVKELQKLKASEYHNMASNYGLKAPQMPQFGASQNPQAALQWAKSNPNDPRAKQILSHLGQ